MILSKQTLTLEQVKEFFPQLFEEGYYYGLELSALKPYGKKMLDGGHLSAYRYREQELGGRIMVMRELAVSIVPCLRVYLDKPLRESAREKIVCEIAVKMREKLARIGLPDNHPYVEILKSL